MTDTTGSKKKRVSGWVPVKTHADIQRVLTRRINRILMDTGKDHHGGQLAALCNAWINAAKFGLEFLEVKKLKEDIERLEEQIDDGKGRH